jgi:hypothetical protein
MLRAREERTTLFVVSFLGFEAFTTMTMMIAFQHPRPFMILLAFVVVVVSLSFHHVCCEAFLVSAGQPRQIFSKMRHKTSQTPTTILPDQPASNPSSSSSSTALDAGVTDPFSAAARSLFGSFLTPAALLAGALVPLGFLAPPLPDKTPWQRKIQSIYSMVSIFALSNELLAIMFATTTSNRLVQPSPPIATTTLPAVTSVYEFILRHYEFPWIATSLHLLMGLIGFMGMIMIRTYTFFPKSVQMPATGMAGATLLAMISIANTRVSGVYSNHNVPTSSSSPGGNANFVSMLVRYGSLVLQQIRSREMGVMAVASLALVAFSIGSAFRNMIASMTTETSN